MSYLQPRTRAIYFGATLKAVSQMIVFAYLPVYAYLTFGERRFLLVTLFLALPAVATFLGAHLWGPLIDRSGRIKPFLLSGLLASGAVLAALAEVEAFWPALFLATGASAFMPAFSTAARTHVTLLSVVERGRAVAALLRFEAWGWLLGGFVTSLALGGSAERAGLYLWGLALLFVPFLVDGLLHLPVRERLPARSADSHVSLAGEFRAAVRLYRRPVLRRVLLAAALAMIAGETFFAIFGIYLTELGGPPFVYGLTLSASTAAGIALYGWAGRLTDRHGSLPVVSGASLGYAATFTLVALVPLWPVLAATFLVPLFAFFRTGATVATSDLSAEEERGSGLGLLDAAESLSTTVGSLTAGLLADLFGLGTVPWAAALLAALAGLLVIDLVRRVGSRPMAASEVLESN